MPRLVDADAAAAAGLVLRRMPREHTAIVHSLASEPELQFKYLKVSLTMLGTGWCLFPAQPWGGGLPCPLRHSPSLGASAPTRSH